MKANNNKNHLPTIDEIRGKSYAQYFTSGVKIDIAQYLKTHQGKMALRHISKKR